VVPPEFLVIASMPRSASTEVSMQVSHGVGCTVWFNEFFNGRPDQTIASKGESKRSWEAKYDNPLASLRATRAVHCKNQLPSCGGHCTVVIKLMGYHFVHGPKLQKLLASSSTLVVVLERDPDHRLCSEMWARHTGDWGTTPHKHALVASKLGIREKRPPCTQHATGMFRQKHDSWYAEVRGILRAASKPSIDVRSEDFMARPDAVRDTILAAAGLQRQSN
jgi:hypothetical protein